MHTRRPGPGRQRLRSLLLSFAMLAATALSGSGLGGSGLARNVDDAADQTAMAIPRVAMPGARGVALPQPLSPADVVRVRHIFALQRDGSIGEASRELDQLESDILHGTILADRYLDTGYTAEASELSAWLARFGEQPEAPAIRAQLETLTQQQADRLGRPQTKANSGPGDPGAVPARTLLVQNEDKAAVAAALAVAAAVPATPRNADSLFAGGVAAWRRNDLLTAKPLFEAAWHSADPAVARAAAAFWVARVADSQHDRGTRLFWLRRAASQPDTFYGPIAQRELSPPGACLAPSLPGKPVVSNADVDALMATPAGQRGFALLQVGERAKAEAELRALWFDAGPQPILGRSLTLVAKAVGLNDFANDLRNDANAAQAAMGKLELPMLRPAGGFRMDPAFVYAVVRHESNFQPLAVSPVGARGLMQLMPGTAVGMGAIGDGQTDRLNDPSVNLAAGQKYLIDLGNNPLVGDDLLKLIAAYGEGPTGMDHWAATVHANGDPFVFLEAIPIPFMRQFIEDVLRFHWEYAAALHLSASSLDDLASGIYPRFAPIKAVPGGMRARPDVCTVTAFKE